MSRRYLSLDFPELKKFLLDNMFDQILLQDYVTYATHLYFSELWLGLLLSQIIKHTQLREPKYIPFGHIKSITDTEKKSYSTIISLTSMADHRQPGRLRWGSSWSWTSYRRRPAAAQTDHPSCRQASAGGRQRSTGQHLHQSPPRGSPRGQD